MKKSILIAVTACLIGCPPPETPSDQVKKKIYLEVLPKTESTALNVYDTETKTWSLKENQKYDMITYAGGVEEGEAGSEKIKDAYILWHEDEFEYADMDELWNAKISSDNTLPAWKSDETWNVSSRTPFTDVKDGRLILSTYRIDLTKTDSAIYQQEITKHNQYAKNLVLDQPNPKRKQRIENNLSSIVGGINFAQDWLYGYCEAEIWVQTPRKYCNFWCGFYSIGYKKLNNDPARCYEQEFDIWEEVSNTVGDQIYHHWSSDHSSDLGYVCNSRPANRFLSYQKGTKWSDLTVRTPGGYLNKAEYVKAGLAWTPERLIFYLYNPDKGVMEEKMSFSADDDTAEFYKKAGEIFSQEEIKLINYIPDIPQIIHLVIASNNVEKPNEWPAVGAPTNTSFAQASYGQVEPFIYYESFKLYKYAGKFDGVQ
ncbi:MAG: hypothetical protein SOZ27_08420 [Spirochaetia bacterium]|nr:hypothetical protein [Spirochaetia bacterium]